MTYNKSRTATQDIPKMKDKIIVLPACVVGSVGLPSVEGASDCVVDSEFVVVDSVDVVTESFVNQERISIAASLLCQSRLP